MSDQQPVIVSDNSTATLIMTAVRGVLGPLAASWATSGFITGDQGNALIGGAGALAVLIWQIYVSKRKHKTLKTVAESAPNSVAQVR